MTTRNTALNTPTTTKRTKTAPISAATRTGSRRSKDAVLAFAPKQQAIDRTARAAQPVKVITIASKDVVDKSITKTSMAKKRTATKLYSKETLSGQPSKATYNKLKRMLLAAVESIEHGAVGREHDAVTRAHLAIANKSRKLLAEIA